MNSSPIRQCAATTPAGERCRRAARPGSAYCHSHRFHRPKARSSEMSPGARRAYHYFTCADCERPIPPGESRSDHGNGEEIDLLCEPCFRLRRQIEARILEACNVAGGLSKEKIGEDLERFGVTPEMTEAARLRLHTEGRLVHGGDR